MKNSNLAQRLWSRVSYGAPGECWLWTGGKKRSRGGYGRLKVNGRAEFAHRVAYRLAKPSMYNPDLLVLHACDNPRCCRPGHLYQGTQKDNIRDCFDRGRAYRPRGEEHPLAKMTADQVRAIRRDTRLLREIAADYGITSGSVSRIKLRGNWKHI